ncbi:MAG TPA: MerR family transcriptional regulator [Ktedonobacteraceae bacterium]
MHNIDELAYLSGVPSRTIRFYNTQGLLPPPVMRGRVAFYDQEHLLVLRIIKDLKEQQHLSLEIIKQLLEIRAREGDVQMNLALKQRLMRPAGQEVELSQEEFLQQTGSNLEHVSELVEQGLLFPSSSAENAAWVFNNDDVLLYQLYERLAQLGLPLALSTLIRFQLRQLVRSEIAALEQHIQPHWEQRGLSLHEQTAEFQAILAITDTLISILHRKLLYSL